MSLFLFVLVASLILSWCGQQKDTSTYTSSPQQGEQLEESIKAAIYTPPSIEEFYSAIEKSWLDTAPQAQEYTQQFRDKILKEVLMSHESHLEEFTDIAMQEKAYGIVTQQVIEASE